MSDSERLTLDAVVTVARRVTLQQGGHIPTVIAEGDRSSIQVQIDPIAPTFEEREQQFFLMGYALSQNGHIGVLSQAFFICEGWMSKPVKGKMPRTLPSQDPQRQEVLMVSHFDVQQAKSDAAMFIMQRNSKQKLLALVPEVLPKESLEVANPLLEALALGFLGSANPPQG